MHAPAQPAAKLDPARGWWLRALLVLQSPRPVFAALRDDSDEAARARQEPVAALVALAGISRVLATPVARRLANTPDYDALLIAVWAFIGGVIYAIFVYWVLGAILYGVTHALGSLGSYRRARHLVAFAVAPLVLALVVYWPLRIGVYGIDLFRTGGDDFGTGDAVFGWIFVAFVAWAAALLALGVRTVHGWSWPRSR